MVKVKKTLVAVAMILVWGWTIFMGTWATHRRGRLVSWGIGISANVVLAFYYSYLEKRPRTFRDWMKQ